MLFKPIAFTGGNDDPAEGMAEALSMTDMEFHTPCRRVSEIPSEGDSRKTLRIRTLRRGGGRPG